VPEDVKEFRAAELMAIQQPISLEINEGKIGQTLKVLVDRKEGDYYYGRTEFDSPEVDNEVLIDAKQHYVRVGDFVQVEITEASDYDLIGKPV
jgi:ribosomal protein S12 methylthiotransferase